MLINYYHWHEMFLQKCRYDKKADTDKKKRMVTVNVKVVWICIAHCRETSNVSI